MKKTAFLVFLILIISSIHASEQLSPGSVIVIKDIDHAMTEINSISFFENYKLMKWTLLVQNVAFGVQSGFMERVQRKGYNWTRFDRDASGKADLWIQIIPTEYFGPSEEELNRRAGYNLSVFNQRLSLAQLMIAWAEAGDIYKMNLQVKFYEPNSKKLIGAIAISSGEFHTLKEMYLDISGYILDFMENKAL